MRTLAYSLVAVIGVLAVADAASAWPFGRVWDKRKAELYSQL